MDVLKEDMDTVDVTVEETGEQAEVGAMISCGDPRREQRSNLISEANSTLQKKTDSDHSTMSA